ncbi:hypothetical protein ACMFMF_010771 [Clarireedia jacksonii]
MSGLQASIWASGNYAYSRPTRPLNFSNAAPTRENAPISTTHSHPCQPIATPKATSIIGDRAYGNAALNHTSTKGSGGLTTSRWAVRGYPGKSNAAADHGEVWTKVGFLSERYFVYANINTDRSPQSRHHH